MGSMLVAVEQYRDTAYKMGFMQGKALGKSDIEKLSVFENPNFSQEKMSKLFSQFVPHVLDEIRGFADALGISMEKASSLVSGFGIPKVEGMGCSSVITSSYAVRNYDFTPEIYDHRLVLIQPKEAYASIGYSLHVIGRHEGVNEKGLFLSFHFVDKENERVGITASMVVRIILDTCQTTEEAVILIKQLPHAWSYSFAIGDKNGDMAVVEVSSASIRVRKNAATLSCTNHFQHEDLVNEKKPDYTNSYQRIEHLNETNFQALRGEQVFDWFNSPKSSLFYHDYQSLFGTLHTFAYLFDSQKVLTALPYGKTLEIDWKNWLEGNDINTYSLQGEVIN